MWRFHRVEVQLAAAGHHIGGGHTRRHAGTSGHHGGMRTASLARAAVLAPVAYAWGVFNHEATTSACEGRWRIQTRHHPWGRTNRFGAHELKQALVEWVVSLEQVAAAKLEAESTGTRCKARHATRCQVMG